MKNLIIDIGNTRTKIAIVCGVEMLYQQQIVEIEHDKQLESVICEQVKKWSVKRAIIASTKQEHETKKMKRIVQTYVRKVLVMDHSTPLPIKNNYATPQTLGRDRVAAAVGAQAIMEQRGCREKNAIVIDMGTAITMDVVTQEGGFEGGVIAPGIEMRFKALNKYTAQLPLIVPTEKEMVPPESSIARSTREAIVEGVLGGVAAEIERYTQKVTEEKGFFNIFLTGGAAKHFEKRIKNAIFANQGGVVPIGLSKILEYNDR